MLKNIPLTALMIHSALIGMGAGGQLAAVDAVLDFGQLVKQVEAFDGSGFSQFHRDFGADTQQIPGIYSNMDGFSDDTGSFARIIDTAWGTRLQNGERNPNGMGLHSAWAQWSMWHATAGALGENYAESDWSLTDWSMYEPTTTLQDDGANGPTMSMMVISR